MKSETLAWLGWPPERPQHFGSRQLATSPLPAQFVCLVRPILPRIRYRHAGLPQRKSQTPASFPLKEDHENQLADCTYMFFPPVGMRHTARYRTQCTAPSGRYGCHRSRREHSPAHVHTVQRPQEGRRPLILLFRPCDDPQLLLHVAGTRRT